jgi:cellulose synthase/poly-beta-1,6-N-acetylglucosamine synthase-like glycosyltransferase
MCEQDQPEKGLEPSVSIVVPVLNGEATIQPLLESLLDIHYPKAKIEIVIVDGMSTDGTGSITAKYPVTFLVEKRKGPNAARNTGIKHALGEIIAFTDSDCIVPKDWIKKTISNFRDPRIGCVGGHVKRFNDDFFSRYADDSIFPVIRTCNKRKELNSTGPLVGCPVGCNMSFRREALACVGGFDENIQYGFEEDELVERICKAGYRIVLDPQVIVWHKHRASVKDLLKQTFKYGKGAGRLLKRPKNQNLVQRWFFINLCITVQTIFTLGLVAFLVRIAAWQTLLTLSLAMLLLPFFALVTVYSFRARLKRKYRNIVAYPFIDFLRMLAFIFGEICGLVRSA